MRGLEEQNRHVNDSVGPNCKMNCYNYVMVIDPALCSGFDRVFVVNFVHVELVYQLVVKMWIVMVLNG